MSEPGQVVELPNGMRLRAPNAVEARILYREIAEQKTYEKHGVAVRPGDCVFDVGANAGFFTVLLAAAHPGLRVYAFEPVPETFALLARNVAEHLAGERVRLFAFGLSDAAGRVSFTCNPDLSFAASARAEDTRKSVRRDAGALAWARAYVEDGERAGQLSPAATRRLLWCLRTPGVNLATLAGFGLVAAGLEARRRLRERVITAEVRPLSQVLRDEDVARIDLLKIDVEGAEWDVLCGIAPEDWPRIRQLVVEVHDADHRVERVAALLRGHGYEVVVDREDWSVHALLGIYTVYARRPA